MAAYTIVARNGKAAKLKCCGQTGLEWVATSGTAAEPSGWRLVPFGSSDFSGTTHALTPAKCTKVTTKTEIVETVRDVPADLTGVNAELAQIRAELDAVRALAGKGGSSGGASDPSLLARIDALETKHNALSPLLEQIDRKIDGELADMQDTISKLNVARPIAITPPNLPTVNVGRQHYMTPTVLVTMAAVKGSGVPYLVGEAGSWKSSLVNVLIQAGYKVTPVVVGQSFDEVDFFGFIDANGKHVDPRGVRKAWEEGHILFLDEIGNASPAGMTSANALMANDYVTFAGGDVVKRHPDFLIIAADNTYGRGADALYNGRSQLDGATLDRMCYLPWHTDWSLVGEAYGLKIAGDKPEYSQPVDASKLTVKDFPDWGRFVKAVSDVVSAKSIEAHIGTRAVINGLKMLLAGVDPALVEFSVIWSHMDADDAAQVKANLPAGLKNGTAMRGKAVDASEVN